MCVFSLEAFTLSCTSADVVMLPAPGLASFVALTALNNERDMRIASRDFSQGSADCLFLLL